MLEYLLHKNANPVPELDSVRSFILAVLAEDTGKITGREIGQAEDYGRKALKGALHVLWWTSLKSLKQ